MKPFFSIILTALITLVSFQVYALVNPDIDKPEAYLSSYRSNRSKTDQPEPKSGFDRLNHVKLRKIKEKVIQRNLFKVTVTGKKKKKAPGTGDLSLEKTSLKLSLWGTVTGQRMEDGWAVIKNLKEKHQDLYRVNDKIQGATIKSILRNKVILTVNGEDQILEVNEEPLTYQGGKHVFSGKKPRRTRNHSLEKPDMLEILEILEMPSRAPRSKQLFKIRPYVKDGEASGVMIYSIKRASVARRLGLQNGDIIQAVNDDEIQDPRDLEDFTDSFDDASDLTISILRRGESKELLFNGQDNTYSIKEIEP